MFKGKIVAKPRRLYNAQSKFLQCSTREELSLHSSEETITNSALRARVGREEKLLVTAHIDKGAKLDSRMP